MVSFFKDFKNTIFFTFFLNIFFNVFFKKMIQDQNDLGNEDEISDHEKNSDNEEETSKKRSLVYNHFTFNSLTNRWYCNHCK